MKQKHFRLMCDQLKGEIPAWDKDARAELDTLMGVYSDNISTRLKAEVINDFLLIDARVHDRIRKNLFEV